jgi:hypothetical protein
VDVLCRGSEFFGRHVLEGGDDGVADRAYVVRAGARIVGVRNWWNVAFKEWPHGFVVLALREAVTDQSFHHFLL